MKKVKCVENTAVRKYLELGAEYIALEDETGYYRIQSLDGKFIGCFTTVLFIDAEIDKFKKENINHPAHYNKNGIEVIDIIEKFELGFVMGNAIKYILRSESKGRKIEDLKKAIWYLEREISNEIDEEVEGRR